MDKFLLGLGLGMVGGVLLAPRSGSETRRMITDKAQEGADYAKSMAMEGMDQMKSMAYDGVDYMKSRAGDLTSMASDLMDKGRSVIRHEGDAARDAAETLQHI